MDSFLALLALILYIHSLCKRMNELIETEESASEYGDGLVLQ